MRRDELVLHEVDGSWVVDVTHERGGLRWQGTRVVIGPGTAELARARAALQLGALPDWQPGDEPGSFHAVVERNA